MIEETYFFGSKVITELNEFKQLSSLIVTNRMADCLEDVRDKVFTRDLFNGD
jgi:UDPglucose 6-dehydrogenase